MKQLLRVVTFTKNLWPYYLSVTLLSLTVALLAQAVPLLTGALVGEIQSVGSPEFSSNLVWIFVVLLFAQDVLSTIISNIQGYLGDILGTKINRDMSQKYYTHMMKLPQSYFDSEMSGTITARLNRSVVQISTFANTMANNFSSFLLTAVISLGIVAYISWPVAVLMGSLYPIFIFLTIRTSGKWIKYQAKKNTSQDIAFGRFQEVISQVKVVKSFVREKSELSFFNKHINNYLKITYPQSRLWHRKDVERMMILNLVMGLAFAVIVYQAINQQISLTEAVMLFQFSALIRFPIFTISFLVDSTQRALSDSKDYFSAMEIKPAITDAENAKTLKVSKGEVSFNEVDFAYDTDKVISGLSFKIAPGTKAALVGESGEGKSTITNLLIRLYEPTSGHVCIDGVDISGVTQDSLRRNIGMVFQDASLFSGTIAENIAYGAPRKSKAAMLAAAKAANAHEFISQFDKGYDTMIGERGLKLSGGQKQRIAIARAIMKDAPILILDEATSSLDNKSELLVQEALERLMVNRTTIIIAHRLSTIQDVDTIITLSGGSVSEVGTPKQLASSGGIYARLLEVQSATSPEARKKALSKYGIVA